MDVRDTHKKMSVAFILFPLRTASLGVHFQTDGGRVLETPVYRSPKL